MRFAEHFNKPDAFVLFSSWILSQFHRVSHGGRILLLHAKDVGADTLPGHRGNELIGQPSQRPALKRRLETAHEDFAMLATRRLIENPGASQQIAARSRGGKAPHKPFENVLFRHPLEPDR